MNKRMLALYKATLNISPLDLRTMTDNEWASYENFCQCNTRRFVSNYPQILRDRKNKGQALAKQEAAFLAVIDAEEAAKNAQAVQS